MDQSNNPIFHFKDKPIPQIAQVGGKGYSLIKMTHAGLAIPPGFVLSVSFFKPWILQLKSLEVWNSFLSNSTAETINKLKASCFSLVLTPEQDNSLKESLSHYPDLKMFAVRSSSPEEDLAGASFAGGYETILGVNLDTMIEAIKKAFASCLDYRVFVYKKEKGFATNDFSIAIVIMAQIASEIAGVGFSLNPLNNDYDEAIFNANWGLGETVVGGLCNPDQYLMNKVNKTLIECKIGKKETQIWLKPDGGTEEKEDPRHSERSLKDSHLKELMEQILIIENYYGQPIDIEWAIEKDILYIIQARPITTHLELPEIMKTKPGEPRNLYFDMTLVIQGFDKPVSVLGADILENFLSRVGLKVCGSPDIGDLHKGIFEFVSGRVYFNLSNVWSRIEKNTFANAFKQMNYNTGCILEEADEKIYAGRPIPYAFNFTKLGLAWRMPITKFVFPYFFMNRIEKNVQSGKKHFDEMYDAVKLKRHNGQLSITKASDILFNQWAILASQVFAPAMAGGVLNGQNQLIALFEKYKDDMEIKSELGDVVRSLPHNITTLMGLDMFRLTEQVIGGKEKYQDLNLFKQDFKEKKLGDQFHKDWEKFMEKYGFRGEREIDVRSPRYFELPELILGQIHSLLINSSVENSPLKMFAEAQNKRKIAHDKLLGIAKKDGFAKDFEKSFQLMFNLAGHREDHKYYLVKAVGYLREIYLEFGEKLVAQGLLKSRGQIFDLRIQNISEMESGKFKPTPEELEKVMAENVKINNLYLKWPQVPPIIDSRGRILSIKKKPLKAGELEGQSVSFGKVKGFVKVLHSVDEKPFLAGEILVTKATDPGWTPLIINCGGILLEVGGMLQHGALVSREFGKPCIVGIDDVTKILKDGDEVEVDATIGVVRRIGKEGKKEEEEKKE